MLRRRYRQKPKQAKLQKGRRQLASLGLGLAVVKGAITSLAGLAAKQVGQRFM